MNLHVVLHVISTLTFVLKFSVDFDSQQDYFYFEGKNQSAHLSRNEKIVTLHLNQGENFSVFSKVINQSTFTFSWIGFEIDGEPMNQTKSEGETSRSDYDSLLFMSPILDEMGETFSSPERILQYSSVNYWYIVLIVLAVGIPLNLKEEGMDLLKKILLKGHATQFSQVPESVSTEV